MERLGEATHFFSSSLWSIPPEFMIKTGPFINHVILDSDCIFKMTARLAGLSGLRSITVIPSQRRQGRLSELLQQPVQSPIGTAYMTASQLQPQSGPHSAICDTERLSTKLIHNMVYGGDWWHLFSYRWHVNNSAQHELRVLVEVDFDPEDYSESRDYWVRLPPIVHPAVQPGYRS